jgi:hypothetical protein
LLTSWPGKSIRTANKQTWETLAKGPRNVFKLIKQAQQYAHQLVDALVTDHRLTNCDGKLSFPWSYGVVWTHITRRQFEAAEIHLAIEPPSDDRFAAIAVLHVAEFSASKRHFIQRLPYRLPVFCSSGRPPPSPLSLKVRSAEAKLGCLNMP